MIKLIRRIKKSLSVFLIFILCINNFAAIVSDNDGSAFITKAEFDSLKNNFQEQISEYQTSIDNKIDGAIAAYLSGIRLNSKTEIETKLTSLKDNLKIKGINNLSSPSVVNKFTPVPKPRINYDGNPILAGSIPTANNLHQLDTSNGTSWGIWELSTSRPGDGFALFGKSGGTVESVEKDTYLLLKLNGALYYCWNSSSLAMWYEQVNDQKIVLNETYNNFTSGTAFRVVCAPAQGDLPKTIVAGKKHKDGVPGFTQSYPVTLPQAKYSNAECDWRRRGYINPSNSNSRIVTQIGTTGVSLINGSNYLFISNFTPAVMLFNSEKKYAKEYKDTQYDETTIKELGEKKFKYGGYEYKDKTVSFNLLMPPFGLENVQSNNTNKQYWTLNQLKSETYTKLLNETVDYQVGFGDGFPLVYLNSKGEGSFSLKIEDIEDRKNEKDEVIYAEEKFSEYEVYVSTEPFSKVKDLTKTLKLKIKANGKEVDTVPRGTTATISFKTDKPRQQLYLWWQGKGSRSGGMLTELSNVTFVSAD